jgi:hypothetical protein
MNKTVYIINDLPIILSEDEYASTFTKEQIESLEKGETVEWIDEDGTDHSVRLIKN